MAGRFQPSPLPASRPDVSRRSTQGDAAAPSASISRQSTLFELRFGPKRLSKPSLAARTTAGNRDDGGHDGGGKGTEVEEGSSGSIREPRQRPAKRARLEAPASTHPSKDALTSPAPPPPQPPPKGTATAPEFLPVTRSDFVSRYRISDLPGADVYYRPHCFDAATSRRWLRELICLPQWYRPTLQVYGRRVTQSRSIAAFCTAPTSTSHPASDGGDTDDGKQVGGSQGATQLLRVRYSGHDAEMHAPFPPLLQHIADRLCSDEEGMLGSEVRFNHAFLNLYEDGSVYIGRHSDNLENKVIVTVSLGAERSWIMERRVPKRPRAKRQSEEAPGERVADEDETKPLRKRWKLGDGSVLVMQGDTQRLYTHEIPKELRVKHPRISITFRQLVYD